MPEKLPALVFDLDGTLTDSKPGILGCMRKMLALHNLPEPEKPEVILGPQVEEWVTWMHPQGTAEEHTAMARDYRAIYDREGWDNNSVFAGVAEALADLQRRGCALYVCTAKRQHFAERILAAFGLAPFFAGIYGDKEELKSHHKADRLADLLRERELGRDAVWMVGDRDNDIDAAHANGIRCVAAAWGYGTPAEWAQADAIASTPAEVVEKVRAQAPGLAVQQRDAGH